MTKERKAYAKESVRRATGREVEDVLRDLYVTRRHSQEEIAVALGVHRMTVSLWLREYDISRDDRGPVEIPA